jgi:hypothetical protein
VSADLDENVVASIKKRITVGLAICGAATAAGFVATRMSLALFLALPAVYLVRSRVDRHIADRKTDPR